MRNGKRKDFMFELTSEEVDNLRCNFGTSSWGGARYSPMASTEQGVAMLSSELVPTAAGRSVLRGQREISNVQDRQEAKVAERASSLVISYREHRGHRVGNGSRGEPPVAGSRNGQVETRE